MGFDSLPYEANQKKIIKFTKMKNNNNNNNNNYNNNNNNNNNIIITVTILNQQFLFLRSVFFCKGLWTPLSSPLRSF